MKNPLRLVAMSVTLLLGLIITGCASFPSNRLSQAGQLSPPAEGSQSVTASYKFTAGWNMGSKRQEHPEKVRQQFEKEFLDALNESAYFATVSPTQEGGLRIEADILNYGNGTSAAVGGFITGFTFGIIPCWGTDNYKLSVKVTTSAGAQKEYLLDDAITTVLWLPMIVASPFKWPTTIAADVRKNMYHTLIQKMQQDGLLSPPKPSANYDASHPPTVAQRLQTN